MQDTDFELIKKGVEIGKEHNSSSLQTVNMIKDLEKKIDDRITRHEDKQDQLFKEVFKRLETFSEKKVSTKMFYWIMGVLIPILIIMGGALIAQMLDMSIVKTILQIADVS